MPFVVPSDVSQLTGSGTRVLIASLPWGVVQDTEGNAQAGVAFTITLIDNTPVISDFTNSFGEMPGELPSGIYKVSVMGGRTKVVHVLSANETVGGVLTGPLLAPDFAADMATQAELNAIATLAAASKKFRINHTWTIGGTLTAGMFIPRIYVGKVAAQAIQLVQTKTLLNSGTSAVVQLTRNGSAITSGSFTPTSAGGVVTTTAFAPVTLADGDFLSFTIASPVGTPADLSLTMILEHTI